MATLIQSKYIADAAIVTAKINDDAVTKDKINADVAGSGLGQNVDGSLEVNVDSSTIEINSDSLRVKDLGITAAKLAADSVTTVKILDANVTSAKIAANAIVDSKIDAAAAISLSKLAALTIDRALVSNGSGVISVSSVTSTELGYLSGVTSSIQTQFGDKISKDGSIAFTANQSMGGFKLTSLGTPTAATDAATKQYVDNVAEGLKPKTAVRVATTANITIATALNSGDSIDGVTLANGDRVLVKDQSTASQNGIYIVGASPARSTDFDSLSPIDEINGALVAVQEGSVNAGKVFVQTGAVATLDTDPINFVFFNSSSTLVGGDGITISGSNVSVDHDGQGFDFSAGQLVLELDGSTLSKSASGLKVAALGITSAELAASSVTTAKINNAAVDETKLAASVAGAGLSGGAGSALAVNVDDSTIEINADTLRVKDLGISTAKIADDAVDKAKINADVAGNGLGQNVDGSLEVNVDNSTIELSADAIQLKAGGITNSHINASAAIATSKLADAAQFVLKNADATLASGVTIAVDSATTFTTYDLVSKKYVDDSIDAAAELQHSEILTLSAGDITAGYKDLAYPVASVASVHLTPKGGPMQERGVDYSVFLTGGAGGVGRITWSALGLDGVLAASDKIIVHYSR